MVDNLATNLDEFNKKDVLDHQKDANKRLKEVLNDGTEDLRQALKGRDYEVHKACYDKFNKPHLDRATKVKKRKTPRKI